MFKDFDLDDIVARYPLPDGVTDDVVNREDLATALAKSANMIDAYRKGGMPVLSEGGNGKPYEFQLSHCWAWYHAWKGAEAERQKSRRENLDQLRLALLGDDTLDDTQLLSPREQKEQYDAERAYIATAMERRQVVRAAEMRLLLDGVFAMARKSFLEFPDRLERRLGLNAEQVEATIAESDAALARLRDAIEQSNLARPAPKAAA